MKRACALLSFIIINTPNHLVTIYLVVIVKNIILTFQTLIMFIVRFEHLNEQFALFQRFLISFKKIVTR